MCEGMGKLGSRFPGVNREILRNSGGLFYDLFPRIGRSARWCIDGEGQRASASIPDGSLGPDGGGDGGRQLLSVSGVSDDAAFGGIAQIAAFQEQAWDFRITSQADTAADHATVPAFHRADGGHRLLATDGEPVAIYPPVISLGSADGRRAAIVMHADENSSAVMVGADHAVVQIDKGIIGTHHNDLEITLQVIGDALGGVECEILFLEAGVWAGRTAVFPAVTSVDDDGLESLWARSVAIHIASRRGSGSRACRGNPARCDEGDER